MDPMASARVPAELRDQVNRELHAINSSPTELINSAYEFFLNTKMLPKTPSTSTPGRRKLSPSQAEELKRSLYETTFQVPETYFQGKSYGQLLEEKLRDIMSGVRIISSCPIATNSRLDL